MSHHAEDSGRCTRDIGFARGIPPSLAQHPATRDDSEEEAKRDNEENDD